jgi:hypothetical protein
MRTRISDALAIDDLVTLLLLWGAPDGSDTSSPAVWKAASAYWSEDRLRLMRAKYEKALRGEQDTELDDPDPMKGFESQYLNRWLLKAGAGGALPGWDDLAVADVPPAAEKLGIAADASGSWFSLGAYGSGFVAPVERMPVSRGRAAFIARVVEVAKRNGLEAVVGAKGMASVLIDDLESQGVQVFRSSFDDLVQASADFLDAVESSAISHGGMPELDAAVLASRWRKVGDRRALDVRGPDISMLEAVALARWRVCANDYELMNSIY